jgi:hypothetical protein
VLGGVVKRGAHCVDGVQAAALIRSSITCQTSLSNWFSFQMP